jgi:hypothetical protein
LALQVASSVSDHVESRAGWRLPAEYRVNERHALGKPPALAHGTLQVQRRYAELEAFPSDGLKL